MALLSYTLLGFLLIQGILGAKIVQEPANLPEDITIPALSLRPEEDNNVENPPNSIPAIPAKKFTPEKEELLKKHFENYEKFEEKDSEYEFATPAIPALNLHPEEDFNVGSSSFSIPAIPAKELTLEEQKLLEKHFEKYGKLGKDSEIEHAIPAIPALNIQPEEELSVGDAPFSIPAIPAMEFSPEEQKVLEKYVKFLDDNGFEYVTPATPAISSRPEDFNAGNPPSSFPAIPELELSPEERKLLERTFEKFGILGKDSGFEFAVPATPALSLHPEEEFSAENPPFSIPAIPAMELSPEEQMILKEHFEKFGKDSGFKFAMPAIPAMRVSEEEDFSDNAKRFYADDSVYSIPAIPAMTISPEDSQFLNDAERFYADDSVYSIPAIPAMKISSEDSQFLNDAERFYAEHGVYSIPATPALTLDQLSNGIPLDKEPFMIPALPALRIHPEDHDPSAMNYFQETNPNGYIYSIPAIPAMSVQPAADEPSTIPALTIGETVIEELSSEMKRCMNMIKSVQSIPQMLRNAFEAGANATKIGLPLLKTILECSKGDLMETMVCLSEKETDIRDFVLLLNKMVHPYLVALYEEVVMVRRELFGCLQINNNSTFSNTFFNNLVKLY